MQTKLYLLPFWSFCGTSRSDINISCYWRHFFIPGLMHYLCSFIKGCHICQLTRKDKPPTRQLQTRIYLKYRPLLRLSMDLKLCQNYIKGHKLILCIIDEVTNYLITVPIYQSRSEEIADVLIENVISNIVFPAISS